MFDRPMVSASGTSNNVVAEVRVGYVPRTKGYAMSGGYTPWQTSFDEDEPTAGASSSAPPTPNPPDPPSRGPRAQPSAYATLLPEVLSFEE